jgi:hypothetical protein
MSVPRSARRVRYIGDVPGIIYRNETTGYAWPVADDPDQPGDVPAMGVMVFAPDDDPQVRFEVEDYDLEELAE